MLAGRQWPGNRWPAPGLAGADRCQAQFDNFTCELRREPIYWLGTAGVRHETNNRQAADLHTQLENASEFKWCPANGAGRLGSGRPTTGSRWPNAKQPPLGPIFHCEPRAAAFAAGHLICVTFSHCRKDGRRKTDAVPPRSCTPDQRPAWAPLIGAS